MLGRRRELRVQRLTRKRDGSRRRIECEAAQIVTVDRMHGQNAATTPIDRCDLAAEGIEHDQPLAVGREPNLARREGKSDARHNAKLTSAAWGTWFTHRRWTQRNDVDRPQPEARDRRGPLVGGDRNFRRIRRNGEPTGDRDSPRRVVAERNQLMRFVVDDDELAGCFAACKIRQPHSDRLLVNHRTTFEIDPRERTAPSIRHDARSPGIEPRTRTV